MSSRSLFVFVCSFNRFFIYYLLFVYLFLIIKIFIIFESFRSIEIFFFILNATTVLCVVVVVIAHIIQCSRLTHTKFSSHCEN